VFVGRVKTFPVREGHIPASMAKQPETADGFGRKPASQMLTADTGHRATDR
jgi:hypothetical protein